jgi:zinc transporter, ZIP family
MTVAAIQGLLVPALDEGDDAVVIVSALTGAAALLASRAALRHHKAPAGVVASDAGRRLSAAGYSARAQVGAAVLTSAPQVPGALLAWVAVEQIEGLLPAAFALAAGAMLMLVAVELLPDAWATGPRSRVALSCAAGAMSMVAVALALQV